MSEFHAQRLRNRLVSALAVAGLLGLLSLVGFVLGGQGGAVVALLSAGLFVAFAPRLSAPWVLRRGGARPLSPSEAPGLHRTVRELAAAAGIDPPALMLLPTPIPNAVTVGEGPDQTLAVSAGLLRELSPAELRAVLAHEIMHLAHGDTSTLRLVAVLEALTASMSRIGVLLAFLQLPLLWVGASLPWAAVLLLVFAPLLSVLLRLALSRSREFDADLGAAQLTGDAEALVSALRKLEAFERRARWWAPWGVPDLPEWLRTHPDTEERIARLEALAKRAASGRASRSRPEQPSRATRGPRRPLPRRGPVLVVERPPGFSEV